MQIERYLNESPRFDGELSLKHRPKARPVAEFSVCEIGEGEVILLDIDRLEYHTLNRVAFDIWTLCNGTRNIEAIAATHCGLPQTVAHVALIELAVVELDQAGLIECFTVIEPTFGPRRRLLKLAAAAVVGGLALPTVQSVTAPDSASAVTRCGTRSIGDPCAADDSAACQSCCCCASTPNNPPMSICKTAAECASLNWYCI